MQMDQAIHKPIVNREMVDLTCLIILQSLYSNVIGDVMQSCWYIVQIITGFNTGVVQI